MLILVVGCGSIGKRHIRNLKALDIGEAIACDVTPERRREVEQEHGIKTFSSLDKALAQKPDAALICTPTSLHISSALAAAQSGCHLFIEKPLSHSSDGIDELTETIAQKALVTLVGCNMRFHPSIALMKELLGSQNIGKVLCARIQAGQYLPDWHLWEDYRQGYSARKSLGGGVILDGIHEIDYITWFLGEVSQIFCFSDKLSSLETDTEDTVEIFLRFKSGAIAEIHLDYLQRSYSRSCQLIGEEGTILWDFGEKRVRLYSARTKEWQAFPEQPNLDLNEMYIEEMKHLFNCIEGKAKPMQDINCAKRNLEIALAAKISSKTGNMVNL